MDENWLDENEERRGSETPSDENARRAERLADYLSSALEELDPLEANIKVVNGRLMRVADYVTAVIEDNAVQQGTSLSGFMALQPAVEAVTKIAREIEKLGRFTTRREAEETRFLAQQQRRMR